MLVLPSPFPSDTDQTSRRLAFYSKVGWGMAPTIRRKRCICLNNYPIEYILSCRQSKIYILLCVKVFYIYIYKTYLKILLFRNSYEKGVLPHGWGETPIRMGQDAFPKVVEYLQVCELVWVVCGG